MTPSLQLLQRICPPGGLYVKYHLRNMLWYVAVLSNYNLFLPRLIWSQGVIFFTGGALVVPCLNMMAYEWFTLLE